MIYAPHKQKSIVKLVLTNETLCLSIPKHNGKSGTVLMDIF